MSTCSWSRLGGFLQEEASEPGGEGVLLCTWGPGRDVDDWQHVGLGPGRSDSTILQGTEAPSARILRTTGHFEGKAASL